MSLFGKRFQVGVDIGRHSVQCASVDISSGKTRVFSAELHPERTGRDDFLSSEGLSQVLADLFGRHESILQRSKRQVVLGIQGTAVMTGLIHLPKLSEQELELAVLSTVTREVPFAVESLEVSHLPVKPLEPGKTAVFYSAWRKVASSKILEVVNHCGLKPLRMETTGVSLARELYRNRALETDLFYAIVNVGFEVTQIAMVKGGYPYYLRDIPVGGRDITYSVQVVSQVSWNEAEHVTRTLPLYELLHSTGPILNEIQYEIQRTFDYFCMNFPCERVAGVFLSGGVSLIPDFGDWLEDELGIPVNVETWQKIDGGDTLAPLFKVAVGLALGQ